MQLKTSVKISDSDLLGVVQFHVDLFDLGRVFVSRLLNLRLTVLDLVLERFLELNNLLLTLVAHFLLSGGLVE